MSEREWNRGMDDAAQGAPPRCNPSPDYLDGYRYGLPPDEHDYPSPPDPPGPTVEELCNPH